MNIEEKVINIIADQLGVSTENVVPSASFVDDLGADSLDLVELMMAMEDGLGREIPDDEAKKLRTVQDAIDFAEDCLCTATAIEQSEDGAFN